MKRRLFFISLLVVLLGIALTAGLSRAQEPPPPAEGAQPQGEASILELMGTAFTYQGQLKSGGSPVNDTCDFQFSLWNAAGSGSPPTGGTQIGSTQTKTNVTVSNGLFTISSLDFSSDHFNGDARWLQIAVRCPAGSGSYTTLSPRQKLNPAPYALALPGLWTRQHATSPNIIGGYSGNGVSSGVKGATIGGGGAETHINSVTDDYGTVGGGYENRAGDGTGSVADKPYATVGGGSGNTASGEGATIGGGIQNTASGGHATIGGGIYNQVTGPWDATVSGGYGNIAGAQGSTVPGGVQARARNFGQMAYASGEFASEGDAQTSIYVVRGITSDDDWHNLFLDGSGQRITVIGNHSMAFDILVVGCTQAGKTNGYRITGVVENVSGTLAQWHSVSTLHEDDSGWGVQVAVDAGGALHVQVNGDTGDTVRWVAAVRAVEVGW